MWCGRKRPAPWPARCCRLPDRTAPDHSPSGRSLVWNRPACTARGWICLSERPPRSPRSPDSCRPDRRGRQPGGDRRARRPARGPPRDRPARLHGFRRELHSPIGPSQAEVGTPVLPSGRLGPLPEWPAAGPSPRRSSPTGTAPRIASTRPWRPLAHAWRREIGRRPRPRQMPPRGHGRVARVPLLCRSAARPGPRASLSIPAVHRMRRWRHPSARTRGPDRPRSGPRRQVRR